MSNVASPSLGLRLGRLFLLLVYTFGGLLVVLLLLENWFLFHPTPYAVDWIPPPLGLDPQDVELISADGTRLHAWWCALRTGRRSRARCCTVTATAAT